MACAIVVSVGQSCLGKRDLDKNIESGENNRNKMRRFIVQGKALGSDPLVRDDGPCFHVMQMSEHTSFGMRTSSKGSECFGARPFGVEWKMDASSFTGRAVCGQWICRVCCIHPSTQHTRFDNYYF
jgi:hypothetical protein